LFLKSNAFRKHRQSVVYCSYPTLPRTSDLSTETIYTILLYCDTPWKESVAGSSVRKYRMSLCSGQDCYFQAGEFYLLGEDSLCFSSGSSYSCNCLCSRYHNRSWSLHFSGRVRRTAKATVTSSCMPCHSAWNDLTPWDAFSENLIFGYFSKSFAKSKLYLKSDKSNGYFSS